SSIGCVFTPLPQVTCGVGECQRTVTCPATCVPGSPTTEVCNGLDDNCNGQVDDGPNTPVTCGVGACQRTVIGCVDGVPQTCTPGDPSPEVCNGIDDDCDGQTDEGAIVADCKISPDTLNLNGQGSLLSFDCKLTDGCDPSNLVPIPGVQVDQVYISRADSAATSGDDVILPNPFTAPCPSPTLGTAYEPGIVEDASARQNNPKGATFKFDVASDGVCTTLDGDRQDLQGRLTAIPDNTNATV